MLFFVVLLLLFEIDLVELNVSRRLPGSWSLIYQSWNWLQETLLLSMAAAQIYGRHI